MSPKRPGWIALDSDNTLWDTAKQLPMPGAQDALEAFRSRGIRVMIHSCNRPAFIRKMCEEHQLIVDGIWGEDTADHGQKPFADLYIDDSGLRFSGDWANTTSIALELLGYGG